MKAIDFRASLISAWLLLYSLHVLWVFSFLHGTKLDRGSSDFVCVMSCYNRSMFFFHSSSKKEKVEKIETPPIDFHKAVALRAIHGKAATPKLPASAKKQSRVVTPATARKQPTPR